MNAYYTRHLLLLRNTLKNAVASLEIGFSMHETKITLPPSFVLLVKFEINYSVQFYESKI